MSQLDDLLNLPEEKLVEMSVLCAPMCVKLAQHSDPSVRETGRFLIRFFLARDAPVFLETLAREQPHVDIEMVKQRLEAVLTATDR